MCDLVASLTFAVAVMLKGKTGSSVGCLAVLLLSRRREHLTSRHQPGVSRLVVALLGLLIALIAPVRQSVCHGRSVICSSSAGCQNEGRQVDKKTRNTLNSDRKGFIPVSLQDVFEGSIWNGTVI